MSVFINEIIEDIKSHPKDWRLIEGGCYPVIQKEEVAIRDTGNSILLSIVKVVINDKSIGTDHLSFIDVVKLERIVKWWVKNATVDMLHIP